jgi:hypothetical protein
VRATAPRGYGRLLLLALALTAALLAAQLIFQHRVHALPYQVPVGGWPDQLFVRGFYERQGDGDARYRWTTAGSELLLRQVGRSDGMLLGLRLGERPPIEGGSRLALSFGGQPFSEFAVAEAPRTYRMLVPRWAAPQGDLVVGFGGTTFSTPNDPRRLGVRLDHASLAFADAFRVTPAPLQVVGQFVLIALCGVTLRRLRLPLWACLAAMALAATGLWAIYSPHLLLLDDYMARLVPAAALLAATAWWLPPLLARRYAWAGDLPFFRTLTALMLLACTLRLLGALFPPFGAHDLPRNIGRLLLVHGGELVITARSAEFGSGFTVYPPAPYVVLLPFGLLIRDPGVLVQGGLALIDGTSVLLIGLLARRVGLGARGALLAALLYVALPISVTGLWWGFTAQTFGQWLMVPLALVLLAALRQPRPALWATACVLLSMALLSHIGVAILAVAWLGLALLLVRPVARVPWRSWWAYALMLAVGCVVGFLLIYLDVVAVKLSETSKVVGAAAAEPFQANYSLIWKGLLISFSSPGFFLLPLGLVLLWRRIDSGAKALLGGWLAAVLVFLAVELVSGLQVRYIYFFMPLGCLALAALLDAIAERWRWGQPVAYALATLLLIHGALYWHTGTLQGIKLSITPLSH